MYGRTEEVTREMIVIGAAIVGLMLLLIGWLI
jgi:hypothetical protein